MGVPIHPFRLAAAAVACLSFTPALGAQTGLLVVAHGAGPEWNARVRASMAHVAWPHGPVGLAFLMGQEAATAGWDAGVDSLLARGARSLVVVPLMVSSHGGHVHEIGFYAGSGHTAPAHVHHAPRHAPPPVPARVTPALDDAAELGAAVAARWTALDAAERARPIVLVGHGPSDDDEARHWIENLLRAATGPLRDAGSRATLRVGLLRDDAPAPVRAAAVAELRDSIAALAAVSGDSVLVMPVLMSTGSIDRVKVPRDLEGLPISYRPAFLAGGPEMARWIERVAGAELEAGSIQTK